MPPDEAHTRAVADRWLDLIQNDAEYPDKICTEDYRTKFYPSGVEVNGRDELRAGVKDTFAATGPRTFQLEWTAVSGDTVAFQGTMRATYRNDVPGQPPVGTNVDLPLCIVIKVRGDRIVTETLYGIYRSQQVRPLEFCGAEPHRLGSRSRHYAHRDQ
jgi:predicted ester cyclase